MSHRRRSRRTVLRTIAVLVPLVSAGTGDSTARATDAPPTASDGPTQYVAVVDRIVDGDHVVLLLEDDGELVDQHVEPRSTFDAVAEGDVLLAVVDGDDLLTYQHLPKRPGRNGTGTSLRDRLVSPLAEFDPFALFRP